MHIHVRVFPRYIILLYSIKKRKANYPECDTVWEKTATNDGWDMNEARLVTPKVWHIEYHFIVKKHQNTAPYTIAISFRQTKRNVLDKEAD